MRALQVNAHCKCRQESKKSGSSGCRQLKRWVCPLTSGHFARLIRRQGGESNEAENSHQLYTKPDQQLNHGLGLHRNLDLSLVDSLALLSPNNVVTVI